MFVLKEIRRSIHRWRLAEHGIVLAVSGGSDSVALLCGFQQVLAKKGVAADAMLTVAHLNHGFRAESDRDALFVRTLCKTLDLPYVEKRLERSELQADRSGSVEAAARHVRYAFLQQTAETLGYRYVATAHTADDQVETVLHRLIRGTGLAGLSGIPRSRVLSGAVTLVRPFLALSKEQLLHDLGKWQQPFCEDASNRENCFTRNLIRNKILPMLREEINPRVDAAILRLAEQTRRERTLIDREVDRWLESLVLRENATEIVLDRKPLADVSSYFIIELLKKCWSRRHWPLRGMGQRQWQALATLLRQGGKRCFPGGLCAESRDDLFTASQETPDE